ncbi:hypothetical protein QFZ40_003909 [Arthrobacter pascens]|nr:hypothetical protein [Arthrobacter pascens]
MTGRNQWLRHLAAVLAARGSGTIFLVDDVDRACRDILFERFERPSTGFWGAAGAAALDRLASPGAPIVDERREPRLIVRDSTARAMTFSCWLAVSEPSVNN